MQDKNTLIAQIVSSFAARPDTTVEDIVALAARLNTELSGDAGTEVDDVMIQPAAHATMRRSLTPERAITDDRIFCLCCGKGFKMLKRHLGAEHGMSEQDYRETFGLSDTYPLVAPSYSARKANYARAVGFGKYERQSGELA